MNIEMTKRAFVKTVTYSVASLAVAVILAVTGWTKAITLEQSTEYAGQRSIEALSESVDSIGITLKKSLYAGSAQQFSSLAAKLWSDCAAAKTELGQLSVKDGELDNVNKFISQVGNYAVSLSKKISHDEDLSDKERNELEKLRDYADKLRLTLDELISRYSDSGYWFGETEKYINDKNDEIDKENSNKSISVMSEDFTDYPTLIYDGPFSDHIYDKTPSAIEGLKKISGRQALEKAKDISNNDALKFTSTLQGMLPRYIFKGGNIEIGITVQGGLAAYMINSRNISDEKADVKKAVKAASDYVNKIGYKGMKETYYECDNGRCVVNFAYEKNGVTIYPDLIKVSVALDNCEVVAFDASDYLMNHKERKLSKPRKSSKEAEKIISKALNVKSVSQAVIPTDDTKEKLCWEFLCSDGKQEVLVYVNCNTLEEENIFLLMENENGKLAI